MTKFFFVRLCPEDQPAQEEKAKRFNPTFLGIISGLVNVSALLLIYIFRIRPWHLRWGATDEEVSPAFPGDALVPNPKIKATHAITINAPASDVWPWLAQLGWGRGGFYSYTFVENRMGYGFHNADNILPQYQNLKAGDRIPFAPADSQVVSLPAAIVEPGRTLVIHGDTRTGDPALQIMVKPSDYVNTSWGLYLDERSDGTTRLVERLRTDYNSTLRNALFYHVFLEPGSFLMARKMLLNVKQRAEAMKHQHEATSNGRVPA
jgi:hypothetical protein